MAVDGTLDVIFTNLASVLTTGMGYAVSAQTPTTVTTLPFGWVQPSVNGGSWRMDTIQGVSGIGVKTPSAFIETHWIDFMWFVGDRTDDTFSAVEIDWRKWHRLVLTTLYGNITLKGVVSDTTLHDYKPVTFQTADGLYVGSKYSIETTSRPQVTLLP